MHDHTIESDIFKVLMLRMLNKTTVNIQRRALSSEDGEWNEINEQSSLFNEFLQKGILKIVKEIEKIKAEKVSVIQLYIGFSRDTPFIIGCDRLSFYKPKDNIDQGEGKAKAIRKMIHTNNMLSKSTQSIKRQYPVIKPKQRSIEKIIPPVNKKSFSIFAQDTTLAAKYDAYTIQKLVKSKTNEQDCMQSFIFHPELHDDDVLGENFGAFKSSVRPVYPYSKPTTAMLINRQYKEHSKRCLLSSKKAKISQSSFSILKKQYLPDQYTQSFNVSVLKSYGQDNFKCPGKFCSLRIICNDNTVIHKSYMVHSTLLNLEKEDVYKIIKQTPSQLAKPKPKEEATLDPMTVQISDPIKNEFLELIFIKKKHKPDVRSKTPMVLNEGGMVRVCYKCYIIYSKISVKLQDFERTCNLHQNKEI